MKIIGTGLSGLVGSRIVELLQNKHQFADFSLDSGVDITDELKLKKAFSQNQDAKTVIHLAAFTDVNEASKQTNDKNGLCYRINVLGTENVAQLCAKNAKYLIHISTDFVFDGKKDGAYSEEDQPNPIEWYGQTKLWAEEKIKNSGCRYLILRIAFPYKAKAAATNLEPRVKLDLVRNIKEKLENGETIKIFGDQIITPTFVDDIAQAVNYTFKNQVEGLYHLAGSTSLSPLELARKIAQVFSLDSRLIEEISLTEFMKNNPRPRQVKMALSNKKLESDFGLRMKTIDEALLEIKKQLVI